MILQHYLLFQLMIDSLQKFSFSKGPYFVPSSDQVPQLLENPTQKLCQFQQQIHFDFFLN